MKYTRLEIRKGFPNFKIKILFEFCIVIPIIAIVAGSLITKIFIKPYTAISSLPETTNKNAVMASSKQYQELKIFTLQAGAFVNKNNALTLVGALKANNFDASIINDEEIYRVIIDITNDEKQLEANRDKLKKAGYSCLSNQFNLMRISDENNKIASYFNSALEIVNTEIQIRYNHRPGESIETGSVNNLFEEFNKSYIEVKSAEEYSKVSGEVDKFNDAFSKTVTGFIDGAEKEDIQLCSLNTVEAAFKLKELYKTVSQLFVK